MFFNVLWVAVPSAGSIEAAMVVTTVVEF